MTMWEWLDSARGEMAVAGIAGSAVSTIMQWEGWVSGLRRFFVGSVTAFFLGPVGVPLVSWLFPKINVPIEHSISVGGFVMGICGIVFVEVMLTVLRLKKTTMEVRSDTKGSS